jgi:hypothetical protein
MNDDWRLQIDVHEEGHARALTERLDAERSQHDLSDAERPPNPFAVLGGLAAAAHRKGPQT